MAPAAAVPFDVTGTYAVTGGCLTVWGAPGCAETGPVTIFSHRFPITHVGAILHAGPPGDGAFQFTPWGPLPAVPADCPACTTLVGGSGAFTSRR